MHGAVPERLLERSRGRLDGNALAPGVTIRRLRELKAGEVVVECGAKQAGVTRAWEDPPDLGIPYYCDRRVEWST